jgi:photosystem II stability/assembly factor-like uncharacterized protein
MKRGIALRSLVGLLAMWAVFLSFDQQKAFAQNVGYQEDFEGAQLQGWNLESGWQVTLDGNNHVLAGQGHTWARSNQSFDGDLRQSFRVKLLRGRIHIVIRLTDASRYFIGFDANGSDLNKQYFPSEFRNGLMTQSALHTLNRWYRIEIVARGSTLEFLVDGTRQWSYVDPQPLTAGTFAFETLDGSQAYVDDIRVDVGSGAAPASPVELPTVSASPQNLSWVRTGGPLGGLGYDVRMRPDNPDVMFVTDAWAGLFTSTDGGANWSQSNKGITTRTGPTGDGIPVFSVTIDPNQPDTVWLGTQFQRGIFKSVDGGLSWKKMDKGIVERDGITFRGFSVQPGDSDIVYAAAEVSSWTWAGNPRTGREFDMTRGVVYKTTNGGQSWQAIWRGNNLARYIWINPQNPAILYISTGFFDREAANSDPKDPGKGQPGGEGILKSTDGGKTWAAANNGLANLYVTSLFMHPSNPDILLAGTGNNQYFRGAGVYLTTDGGASWTRTLSTEPYNIEAVEFSTSNPSIAYAGNDAAIHRSEDGGHSWRRVSGATYWGPPGVCAGFPIDFQVDPRNPDRVFANEYGGGNFLSEDGGQTWTDASRGYTGALMRGLAVASSSPAHIYAVARSGIFMSQDGGASWQGLSYSPLLGLDWTVVAVDPGNSQHILAETGWVGLGSSRDGGHSWQLESPDPSDHMSFRTIAFSPSDPSIVYAGIGGFFNVGAWDSTMPGKGVYVSLDGGGSWSPGNSGLAGDANVSGLAIHPADAQEVYAATTNHGLLRSTDGAGTWAQVRGGLPTSKAVLSVAISPADPNVLFVGLERGGMFTSANGGQSWHRVSAGLIPEASVTSIVFDPTNPSQIFASDLQSGVYRSIKGGDRWAPINDGLLSRAINALALSTDGLHLYAATEGNGVYRLDLNGQPPATAVSPESQVQPTATSQFQDSMPTPTPSKPVGGGQSPCAGALLSLALIGAALLSRRS